MRLFVLGVPVKLVFDTGKTKNVYVLGSKDTIEEAMNIVFKIVRDGSQGILQCIDKSGCNIYVDVSHIMAWSVRSTRRSILFWFRDLFR